MQLTIASGKGGTGKTLIATNLAQYWAEEGRVVTYVDADAEEPNGHLFLRPERTNERRFAVKVPTLNGAVCGAHGKCQEICAFNAILATNGSVLVFNELCHNCGACLLACPDDALREEDREIGTITDGHSGGLRTFTAKLDVGEARVTPLIAGVIDQAVSDKSQIDPLIVIDSPPGTSCSAMAAVERADFVLLVTEPTPFGLHDLKLAIDMGRALGRKIAAVINRCDIGDTCAKKMLEKESIPVLAEIPFERAVAQSYAVGDLAIKQSSSFENQIVRLAKKIEAEMGGTQR